MSSNGSSITRLLSVVNEHEAAAIVAALADRDIVARYVGGYTAGFLAEAPGEVHVMVRQEDLARATDVVEEHNDSVGEIDWSTVDYGDSSPLSDDEDDEDNDAAIEYIEPRPLQVSLRTLLVIQTVICVLLAFSQSPLAASILPVGIVYALVAFGTIQIISRRERANELLRYGVSSLVILVILFFAVQLFQVMMGILSYAIELIRAMVGTG